ncbi:uncharacterized protein BCR38DRAFT_414280 [Pseudomassariella vexata]|uniref:Uncharacterized protein n=1 Tax=Pseudomassariella vexata TaxID=1141098 RepID=A0A1Y2DCI9_9PEZI|nr:uncharacterized protein BCR38DRAFT_414280 [Pseudomassariella vexata]ORY56968.1 hypothetical protein BCR38DRAFT_414280 [Pseudomassariella vexata]
MAWEDAVGTVASISSLLQIACEVTKLSYRYLSSVKNAHSTRREYLKEVNALVVVLLHLKEALNSYTPSLQDNNAKARTTQLRNIISDCQDELTEIETTLGRVALGVLKLFWPLKEKDLREQINTFQRYRSMFDSFMSANILATTTATLSRIDPLLLSHERSQLLAVLPQPDTISKPRTLTCPGTASLVVKDLLRQQQQPGNLLLTYFFCDFANEDKQKIEVVLQCIVYQLVVQGDAEIVQIAKDTLSQFDAFRDPDILEKTIRRICKSGQPVVLILDAEDEMQSTERLMMYFSKFAAHGCRILLTSRRPETVLPTGIALASDSIVSVKMESPTEDILKLAESRFRDSVFRDSASSELLERIVEKSNGTSVKEVKKILDSAPKDLDQVFESSIRRIDDQPSARAALAHRVIGWIINARRLLTAAEIIDGFAIEEGMDEIDPEAMTNVQLLLNVCAGLVTIDETSTIRLVHTSVYEFFQPLKYGLTEVQVDIAQACIRYLCAKPMSTGPAKDVVDLRKRLDDMPFLEYASHNWGGHITDQTTEDTLSSLILLLLDNEDIRWSSFQALQFDANISNATVGADIFASIPHGQAAIHVSAYWGLPFVTKSLLKMGHLSSPRDSEEWTPLHWAAANGHVNVVAVLVEAGAELNATDSEGWTPLFWASFRGHISTAETLLHAGAGYQVKSKRGLTALDWAIGRDELDIVWLLLDWKPASGKSQDTTQTGLTLPGLAAIGKTLGMESFQGKLKTSRFGNTESAIRVDISHLTLDPTEEPPLASELHTFTIVDMYGQFRPPVSRSTWRTHQKAEKIGIKEPATWKSNLLQSAIITGDIAVARMLVKLGADVNAQKQGLCPIYAAVRKADVQFLELLLENGAQVSFSHEEQTPLIEAVRFYGRWGGIRASIAVVTKLVEHGADVNRPDRQGCTPLMHAIKQKPDLEICKVRISKGADVNVRNCKGESPLHIAMSSREIEVLKLLVSTGANVQAQDLDGKTVLHAAVYTLNFNLVKSIIDSGAQQGILDNDGQTAFHMFLQRHIYSCVRGEANTGGVLEDWIQCFARFYPSSQDFINQTCQDGKAFGCAVDKQAWPVLEVLLSYNAALPTGSELLSCFHRAVFQHTPERIQVWGKHADLSPINRHIMFAYLIHLSQTFYSEYINDEPDIETLMRESRPIPLRPVKFPIYGDQEDIYCQVLKALSEAGFHTNVVLDEIFVNAIAVQ